MLSDPVVPLAAIIEAIRGDDVRAAAEALALVHALQHGKFSDFRSPLDLQDCGLLPLLYGTESGELFIANYSRLLLESDELVEAFVDLPESKPLGRGTSILHMLRPVITPCSECVTKHLQLVNDEENDLPWGATHVLYHLVPVGALATYERVERIVESATTDPELSLSDAAERMSFALFSSLLRSVLPFEECGSDLDD